MHDSAGDTTVLNTGNKLPLAVLCYAYYDIMHIDKNILGNENILNTQRSMHSSTRVVSIHTYLLAGMT